jgi:flagellar biosynthesis/type III secretory pathway protein FliH
MMAARTSEASAAAHWIAVHRDPALAIATNGVLVPAAEVPAFTDTLTLAQHLAALHAEREAALAQARAAAREAGLAEGRDAGHAEALAAAAPDLVARLQALEAAAAQERAALRDAVVPLALLVLRRVAADLPREELLAALLRQALQQVLDDTGAATPCTVRLHPAGLAAVQQALGDAAVPLGWRADPALAPLDCVVETPAGRLLAGLPVQLERVEAALRRAPLDAAA